MARVFSRKAGKDYPDQGIKKGEVYYAWTVGFRGREQKSKTPPPRSATIGSPTLSSAVACDESFQTALGDAKEVADVVSAIDDCLGELENVMSEYDDSISTLQDAFPNGCPPLEEKEEQKGELEGWQSELESAKSEVEALPDDDESKDKSAEEQLEAALEVARGVDFPL